MQSILRTAFSWRNACDDRDPASCIARLHQSRKCDGHRVPCVAPAEPSSGTAPPPLDRLERNYERAKRNADARKWFEIKVTEERPIGLLFVGDPHVDDNGCSWPLLRKHAGICRDTEGMYAINIGDSTNCWGGRLIKKYADQGETGPAGFRRPQDGRGNRARTCDLRFWRPPLYQLSYTPKPSGLQAATYTSLLNHAIGLCGRLPFSTGSRPACRAVPSSTPACLQPPPRPRREEGAARHHGETEGGRAQHLAGRPRLLGAQGAAMVDRARRRAVGADRTRQGGVDRHAVQPGPVAPAVDRERPMVPRSCVR